MKLDEVPANVSAAAEPTWVDEGDVIMPWVLALPDGGSTKLSQCVPSQSVFGFE